MPGNDSTQVVAGRELIFYSTAYLSTLAIPTDSAWSTAFTTFTNRGLSRDGLHASARKTLNEIIADQAIVPVLRTFGTVDLRLRANLLQTDLVIAQEATGLGTAPSTVAAASGTRGHTDWAITGSGLGITYISVAYDIKNPGDGEAIRFFGWRGIPIGDVNFDFDLRTGNQINHETALVPDDANGGRILTVRDIIPALP